MQFQPGDKVRFLNEKGEGTFIRTKSGGMALVEIEDGFQYEFPINQLVPVAPIAKAAQTRIKSTDQKEGEEVEFSTPVPDAFPQGLFLAFIPKNQQFPGAGLIELSLINHSDYDMMFTISLKDGGEWLCIQCGKLSKNERAKIDTLQPQDFDEWGQVKTDVLFFSNDPYKHRAPLSSVTKLKGVKFIKDSTYSDHLLTGKRSYITEVCLMENITAGAEEQPFISNDQLRRMMELKDRMKTAPKVSVPHLKNQVLEKEVDLHIEELMDNWSGMSNAQLLDVQLKHTQKELDAAIAAHMRRVVFIHGVGNGRLKQEVRKLLATYKGIRFHDASFQRYGFGATEVEII
jgi:hypothetical protein